MQNIPIELKKEIFASKKGITNKIWFNIEGEIMQSISSQKSRERISNFLSPITTEDTESCEHTECKPCNSQNNQITYKCNSRKNKNVKAKNYPMMS